MDPLVVDRLTRACATAGTRRRLVALLGLLPLASTMPFPQAEPAEAGGRRHRHKRGHHPGGDKRQRKGKHKGKQKGQHKGQHQQTPSPPTPPPPPSPPPSPPCVPQPQTACAAEGRACGPIADGCGGMLDCGTCGECQTCNGAGQCVTDPGQNQTTCDGSGTATSVCCNGTCCDGCCDGAGTCGACRVFVTSTHYDGKLDGLIGADAQCLARAAAGGLPGAAIAGNYKAWLSDSIDSPSTRFRCTQASCSAQGYRLVDGTTVVATDWTDLTTCDPGNGPCLAHAITVTELNVGIGMQNNVWTHTTTFGTAGGVGNVHCQDWSTNDPGQSGDFAIPGARGTGDASWTQFGAEPCGGDNITLFGPRLYCFQQS